MWRRNEQRIRRLGLTVRPGTLALALLLTACEAGDRAVAPDTPNLTPGSGSQSTLLGRGSFAVKVREVNRHGSPLERWELERGTQPNVDVAVQRIEFQPGGYSGWHRHPGPVFIQVLAGTMTFYEADDPHCQPIVVTAPGAFLDAGEHGHIARNETTEPAENLVVYFAPPGADLRIDVPDPGHCPF